MHEAKAEIVTDFCSVSHVLKFFPKSFPQMLKDKLPFKAMTQDFIHTMKISLEFNSATFVTKIFTSCAKILCKNAF